MKNFNIFLAFFTWCLFTLLLTCTLVGLIIVTEKEWIEIGQSLTNKISKL